MVYKEIGFLFEAVKGQKRTPGRGQNIGKVMET